jgi:hypothetical protein
MASGKKALSEAILSFSRSQNVVVSAAFCDRLGLFFFFFSFFFFLLAFAVFPFANPLYPASSVQEHIAETILREGKFGLAGLGSLNVV